MTVSSISYSLQKSLRLTIISRFLQPVRHWLDAVKIDNRQQAKLICLLIPSQCPFEREIKVYGKSLFHIPPLCKLNPLYEEFVGLRFRSLCFLSDVCKEDVSIYCR